MWQPINSQGDFEVVDSLGSDLSAILHCPVRFCSYQYDKPLFECKCGLTFLKFAVEGCQSSGDWGMIIQRHKGG